MKRPAGFCPVIDSAEFHGKPRPPLDLSGAGKATLPEGDFVCCESHIGAVALERKTHQDLLRSLGHGRERFEAEVLRLRASRYRALVIEANMPELFDGADFPTRMAPSSVIGSLAAWHWRHGLAPIFLGRDRARAAIYVERMLMKAHEELQEGQAMMREFLEFAKLPDPARLQTAGDAADAISACARLLVEAPDDAPTTAHHHYIDAVQRRMHRLRGGWRRGAKSVPSGEEKP